MAMDREAVIVISDSEGQYEDAGTMPRRPVVVDLVSSDEEDVNEESNEFRLLGRGAEPPNFNPAVPREPLESFSLFKKLPIELRLQIWNWAFPERIVNLTFDDTGEIERRFFSFNSSPPILLQIHRETRELALKTYKTIQGSDKGKAVWVDFARDIILANDSYKDGQILPEGSLDFGFDPKLVQNLAFGAEKFLYFEDGRRKERLEIVVRQLMEDFTSLKKLYIIYEDGVNPYSRGRIRFFPMERTCVPDCDDKGCINLAVHRADWQDAIDSARTSEIVVKKNVDIRFVGAWRGGSRTDLGHAVDGYEDESGDEGYPDEDLELEDGWDSDFDTLTPAEKRGQVKYSRWFLDYDEEDDNATFSDHEGWDNPEVVPEHEIQDLRDDERRYQIFVGKPHPLYDLKHGKQLSLTMRDMNDYYEWRKKEHPAKCYPIHHPDGSYRAM